MPPRRASTCPRTRSWTARTYLLGSRAVPALAANAQSTATTVFTIPTTAGGQFYIIAKANADGTVTETDTTNNTAVSALVKIGADLAVVDSSRPRGRGAGRDHSR